MRPNVNRCFALGLLLVFWGCSTAFAQSFPAPALKSRETNIFITRHSASTTSFRAGFVPYKLELVWGEPLEVTFNVENLGPTNFEFMFGGDYRGMGRHDRFKIAVTDAAGKPLPDPHTNGFGGGGFMQKQILKPGQTFSNIVDLTQFRTIPDPGQYSVQCSFDFDEPFASRKGPTNPIVHSSFHLAILERTPQRVAVVLDELVAKAQAAQGDAFPPVLALIARFGRDDAVPRLIQLARHGALERRSAAVGALARVPNEASLDAVLGGLNDDDATIRAAAAGALGAMKKPRAVEALLIALPQEQSPVAEAVVLALGASQSERALPVLTRLLDQAAATMQSAAVTALASFGGPEAISALKQRVTTHDRSLRYQIVLALAEKLHQPMPAEWLLPILISREQGREWLDSMRLMRMYGGEQAIPALLSCLDFDAPWSGRNWWILNEVRACPKAPPADYAHDPNSDGTPDDWQKNLALLRALKLLAGPIPVPLAQSKSPLVPYLKTDPPIDFTPSIKPSGNGIEIASGFLRITIFRNGSNHSYPVSEAYGSIYQVAYGVRSLLRQRAKYAALEITPEQADQLNDSLRRFCEKLCGSQVSDRKAGNFRNLLLTFSTDCPTDPDWHTLFLDYKEAPAGPLREQAEAALLDAIRVFSQNYHAGTVEFANASKKVLTPAQVSRLP